MTASKYETISLRLTKADAALIRDYADKEGCSVSALIRSTMRRKISQEQQYSENFQQSPSPNFDKISFGSRELTLRPWDMAIAAFLKAGLTVQQAETAFMLSQALGYQSELDSTLSSSELKDKVTEFYKNRVQQLSSDYETIFQ